MQGLLLYAPYTSGRLLTRFGRRSWRREIPFFSLESGLL